MSSRAPLNRVAELFRQALDVPADQRQEWLERTAAGDRDLLREVRALLAVHAEGGGGLSVALNRAVAGAQPDQTPARIGPYQILQELGHGGMGVVYLAEQREPVRRRVALKVIKLGMDSKAVLARFDAERQALSLMEHSSIARVYDSGATERGQPWFAMEYVKGIPITDYCDQNKLGLVPRLRLLQQVCAGIQHAHLKGVMHRDLKPSNVLVTLQDGMPTPKIIDFGLAKAVDHRLVQATLFTEQGQVIGTPEYMSPEQAGLDGLDVDTRTDVYSLGVMLYELLTGDLPFPTQDLRRAGYSEMQRILRETEPPKPSARVTMLGGRATEAARRRGFEALQLRRTLQGDLDWIALKALEKDRTRRYQTALELAADLERHMHHEPVLASPPSVGYRVRKFVRRYRGQVVAAVLMLVMLLAGVATTTWFFLEARSAARAFEAKGRDFDQLAGVVLLNNALAAEHNLYPATPAQLPAMQQWLREHAEPLLTLPNGLRRTIGDLTLRPEAATVAERDAAHFLRTALEDLIGRIEDFERDQVKGVRQRIEWAGQIGALTTAHPLAKVSWDDAAAAIARADGEVASELYRDHPISRLPPQVGLVPIGMNPATKLWEFYDLRSAWDGLVDPATIPIPRHSTEGHRRGHIEVGEGHGIVFVLVPGGRFWMGAEPEDDPDASTQEAPSHERDVEAFFLARHELTQGQWQRLAGGTNPSAHPPSPATPDITLANPVENLSWARCQDLLRQHGLVLPTEEQWEYACRAGKKTPWWTGQERLSLATDGAAANIADRTAGLAGKRWVAIGDWPDYDDGYAFHAPAGALRCNPWGFHHMPGNVWEWCADEYLQYGTGLAMPGPLLRAIRGGAFWNASKDTRSSTRTGSPPDSANEGLGLRAARVLAR